MTQAKRTSPIGDDADFTEISALIDAVLVESGYRLKCMTGSHSWLGTARTGRSNETLMKLCFFGDGKIWFGCRKDFVGTFRRLQRVDWPLEFAIAPQTEVIFLGFTVRNDGPSRKRVFRLFRAMQLVNSNFTGDYESRLRRFDNQLRNIS